MSLKSIICKTFERILKNTLLSFLSETQAISFYQHGFLPHPSCPSYLLVFEETVTHMMNKRLLVDIIYLDFAKAFDSVTHRFLLLNMTSFGLGGAVD